MLDISITIIFLLSKKIREEVAGMSLSCSHPRYGSEKS